MADKKTSLMANIEKGKNKEAIALIDELGVDVEMKNGESPLLIACLYDNTEVAKYAIKEGGNVNATDNDGNTPLIYASQHGNFAIVKELVKKGAEVNAKNRYEMTPIMKAISKHSDQLDLIEFLLKNGADPYIMLELNKGNPNRIANNAYEMAEYLEEAEVIKLIKKYAPKK